MKQKPEALLDLWQPPPNAGDPVGVLATTFTFDAEFFESNCLARFLAVETVSEGSKSIVDQIGDIELQQALRTAQVTVLADRSQTAERSTLQWDALHCLVPGGLLHSKVSILLWENATRLLIGSANLTAAGYRSNIEIVLPADLGPHCILPPATLNEIANEVSSYLDLVPGLTAESTARARAEGLLTLFRRRIAESSAATGKLVAIAAPTNRDSSPLSMFNDVWKHARPTTATQLSPFWDSSDPAVLRAVDKLVTGQPAVSRKHNVLTTINQQAEIYFPKELFDAGIVDYVYELPAIDKDERPLHAKCLRLTSDDWIAVLVGSSNHTIAGLGLSETGRRHRELNIWLGAPRKSAEGKALDSLLTHGQKLSMDNTVLVVEDEDDDSVIAPLPAFFGYCELRHVGDDWILRFTFDPAANVPTNWEVRTTGERVFIDSNGWAAADRPTTSDQTITADELSMHVIVRWDGTEASWPVVVDDPLSLPPTPTLLSLSAYQLLTALTTGRSISQATRDQMEIEEAVARSSEVLHDPHKRFESDDYLLRRGRALGQSLNRIESILGRPAATLDVLRARLAAPLGPLFIANALSRDALEGEVSATEAAFTIAELALSLGRIDWSAVVEPFVDLVDNPEQPIVEAITKMTTIVDALTPLPPTISGYCTRSCAHALQEVSQCVPA